MQNPEHDQKKFKKEVFLQNFLISARLELATLSVRIVIDVRLT